ncbi:MAG: Serine/threonine protein kinase [Myxococcaceae bacterium]|nr:Serine/threonine protein kinase [Myxococcaceae bacterium]
MATVYVARQVGAAGFERLVVVKRVHRHLLENASFTDMFLDEARVASMIHHPNVVPVVDVVEAEGELFLVMNYIDSATVAKLRHAAGKSKQRIPPAIAARIVADALAGLHAAHEAVDMQGAPLDVVHRDVSPQNIIVGADGVGRLIDFGIAKAQRRITETQTGSLKGKYGYMSPEQSTGKDLDRRSDVFAMGVVLYEMLTNERLFASDNEFETIRRIAEAPITNPSIKVNAVPAALDAVVQKALARPVDQRYANAAEFLDALTAAITPASHREVAAFMTTHVGAQLQERRETLRALLAGELEPLGAAVPGALSSERPTSKYASFSAGAASSRRGLEFTPAPSSKTGGGSSADHTLYVSPTKRRTTMAIVLGLLIVSIAGAAFMVRRNATDTSAANSRPTGHPTDGVASASTSVGAPSSSTSAAVSTDIELLVLSDRRIDSVRATGLHRVEIDGTRAKISVTPWTGPLAITAQLEGNKTAHATVTEGGAHEVVLTLDTRSTPTTTTTPGARHTGTAPAHSSLDINTAR